MDWVDALTALSMAVGFLLVVMVEKALGAAGFELLSTLAYPVGYGSLVLVAWYVWIRPLDIRSPSPDDRIWRSDPPADGKRRDPPADGERRDEDADR